MMNDFILYISLGLAAYYTFFLIVIYIGLTRLKKKVKKKTDSFISVIIPFRNEEGNILQNLLSISKSTLSNNQYEIIYVNDFSDDNSVKLLNENNICRNIKVIDLPEEYRHFSGKKIALEYGISKSLGDIIVTSDADCEYEPEWLENILHSFDVNTGFVIGLVEYFPGKTFFKKLQEIEFSGLVIAGAGLAGAGYPIICNGANAAYKKNLFYSVNGFKDKRNISSGDDLFIMQKIKKNTFKQVEVCIEENSIVRTKSNKTISQFNEQRKRWSGKSIYFYDKQMVGALSGIFFYYLNYFILLIFSFSNVKYLLLLIGLWVLKIITEYIILVKGRRKLHLSFNLNFTFLTAELLHIPYIIYSTLMGVFGTFKWKNRNLRT